MVFARVVIVKNGRERISVCKMSSEELIKKLREQNTELCNKAAETILELEQDIDEWIRIFDVLNDRENRHKYLDYWRKKAGKDDLWYPDGDQVYKDFWEQKERADRLEKELKEYKMKESWEKFPDMMGKC